MTDDLLVIFTDGACSGNPGPGGWAWALENGPDGSGSETDSTNQRMEVWAVLDALQTWLPRHAGPIRIVSDSTYVVNCFRDSWWRGWLSRGWKNSQKQPVANQDLWKPLVALYRDALTMDPERVTFQWVKGHSGHVMNDRVDALAVSASKLQSRRIVRGLTNIGREAGGENIGREAGGENIGREAGGENIGREAGGESIGSETEPVGLSVLAPEDDAPDQQSLF